MRWRSISILSGAIAAVAGLATPALAHSGFVESDPAPCSIVGLPGEPTTSELDQVVVTFSEEVDSEVSSFELTDSLGGRIASGAVDLDDLDRSTVVIEGFEALAPGLYRVEWEVQSAADADLVTGGFGFSIGQESAADCALAELERGEDGGSAATRPLIILLWVVSFVTAGALLAVSRRRRVGPGQR
ncbi:MAG: hypothetical protein GY724_07810 [Actinomycetia bacterium]|nr:hypothetical protein [Actinomycetes bacterium]